MLMNNHYLTNLVRCVMLMNIHCLSNIDWQVCHVNEYLLLH